MMRYGVDSTSGLKSMCRLKPETRLITKLSLYSLVIGFILFVPFINNIFADPCDDRYNLAKDSIRVIENMLQNALSGATSGNPQFPDERLKGDVDSLNFQLRMLRMLEDCQIPNLDRIRDLCKQIDDKLQRILNNLGTDFKNATQEKNHWKKEYAGLGDEYPKHNENFLKSWIKLGFSLLSNAFPGPGHAATVGQVLVTVFDRFLDNYDKELKYHYLRQYKDEIRDRAIQKFVDRHPDLTAEDTKNWVHANGFILLCKNEIMVFFKDKQNKAKKEWEKRIRKGKRLEAEIKRVKKIKSEFIKICQKMSITTTGSLPSGPQIEPTLSPPPLGGFPEGVAQSVDWNNKPWLDPRVIKCVREYLDKVLVPINNERRRSNQPVYWRFDDWGRPINEYATPDPRGVDGQWDNPTHFVYGFFKSTYRGGVQKYVKEECVARGGDGPGPDPPPPSPPPAGDDKCCEEYALLAVCQQNVNTERDCGLRDPPARWHINYQRHFDWCLAVAEDLADVERRAREDQLRDCINRQCDEYANTALGQHQENLDRDCGYTGARWHFDYQRHYEWCFGVSRDFADSEMITREDLLGDCNGGQPPPDGKCECDFAFIGMTPEDNDRVGIHDDGYDADGKQDGQFALTIRCADEQTVKKLHIKGSLSRYGRENLPQFDTEHGNQTWLLGVYRDGVRLDRRRQPFSDTVVGDVNYGLYAGDPNIPDGQPYTIEVLFDGQQDPVTCGPTVVSKPPPKTTRTRADTDKDDSPFDQAYEESGNLLAHRGADRDAAYAGQVYADSYAEGVKGRDSSERLSRELEGFQDRTIKELDDIRERERHGKDEESGGDEIAHAGEDDQEADAGDTSSETEDGEGDTGEPGEPVEYTGTMHVKATVKGYRENKLVGTATCEKEARLEIILYQDGTVNGLFSTYFGASHPGEDMICHVKESPWPKDPDKRPRQGSGSHNKKNRTFTLSVEGAKVEGKYDQNSIWGKGSGKNIFGGEGISFDIEIREFKLNRIKK